MSLESVAASLQSELATALVGQSERGSETVSVPWAHTFRRQLWALDSERPQAQQSEHWKASL